MTKNQKCKKYLEKHPGATYEDWQNQRHRMHIIQYKKIMGFSKHTGSKKFSRILNVISKYA